MYKLQIPSTKFQINSNYRNPKNCCFVHSELEFEICLGFEIWDLEFSKSFDVILKQIQDDRSVNFKYPWMGD